MAGDLVAGARSGERFAFEALLRLLIDPGCQVAFAMLRNREEAEDAVQEACFKAWRKYSQLRGDTTSDLD